MKKVFKTPKAAFTIAELLMVLMVIGVIASVTIGALWYNRPDEKLALFRKAFYVTEKTLYNVINKDEYYPYDSTKEGLLNTIQATDNGKEIENAVGITKLCTLFAREINVADVANCSRGSEQHGRRSLDAGGNPGAGGNFRTVDGIVWSFPVADFATVGRQIIEIDVNGTKPPNCNADDCTKPARPDRFRIAILKNGAISVDDELEKEYLSSIKKMTE